ncbi:MAG: prolyl oligopeptidase family serine peptidase [Prevotella sp.]|nr:prolyl oligopeptidase family serine peptidase [Prevotella sp.]
MKTNPFRYFVTSSHRRIDTLFFLRFATKASKLVVPCYFVTLLFCYFAALPSLAQGTVDDYNRAYSLQTKFSAQNVYHWAQNVRWVDSTHVFHYSVQTPEGQRFILFDVDKNSKQEFASDKELNDALAAIRPPQQDRPRRFGPPPMGGGRGGRTPFRQPQRHWMEVDEEQDQRLVTSPDGKWEAWVEGYNLIVHEVGRPYSEKHQLTHDGTIGHYYSNRIYWSPDSRKLFVCKRKSVEKRYAYYVESSPQDQLQPILHTQEYAKPGDELPQYTPYIFNLSLTPTPTGEGSTTPQSPEAQKQEPFSTVLNSSQPLTPLPSREGLGVGLQYSLDWFQWTPDSRYVTMEYNQRGHKLYQLLAMDAETGQLTTLIEERSDKFVNYNRIWRRWLKDGRLLWTSERDNWNHLYLYGPTKNISKKGARRKASASQSPSPFGEGRGGAPFEGWVGALITRGPWCVREVLHVDEDAELIYFTASGVHPDEDPYNIHYFTIRFDGTDMCELTPEPGNHRAVFSSDRQYLVDTYSTPSQAPVTKLYAIGQSPSPLGEGRGEATSPSLRGRAGVGLSIETADLSCLVDSGWQAPEVFVAPGRDGKTPMWGIIQRPTNFDPSKKYPVIEYIYAGPGDSYTPKSFQPFNWNMTPLAELGFIVVQLDGMGTSWRGKEFEEVCYKNLKDAGFPDRKAWIRAAAQKYPYMDADNVGIFGASAGGQESTTAVLLHGDFYKAAYSSCGCHDNRMDKIWWNEQWMGYPVDSSYIECSNVYHASKLERPLMLVVGELDDNVDPASTMQVADALIRAGKDFELVVLPGVHHTMGERYGEHKRYDFFVRNLLHVEPPKWNEVKTQ